MAAVMCVMRELVVSAELFVWEIGDVGSLASKLLALGREGKASQSARFRFSRDASNLKIQSTTPFTIAHCARLSTTPTSPLTLRTPLNKYRYNGWRSRQCLQVCARLPRSSRSTVIDLSSSTLIRSNGVFLSTIFVGAFASNMYEPRNSYSQV